MRPDTPATLAEWRAAALAAATGDLPTGAFLDRVLDDPLLGRVALVTSFGAESVVLLHLLAARRPDLPVLFVETGLHFPETLAYQRDLARHLGLGDLRLVRPALAPDPGLAGRDPDACCAARKVRPLETALSGFDTWITGRKRFQNGQRSALPRVEPAGPRVRLNPLADWSSADLADWRARHDLPPHPLLARGFGSIGCAPCTRPVRPGQDPRAGRWAGQDKTECGIHFIGGRPHPHPTRTEGPA